MMNNGDLSRKDGLYIKYASNNKGRGLFCMEPIVTGEVLEIAPAIICPEKDTEHLKQTLVVDYTFEGQFSRSTYLWANVTDHTKVMCVALGVTSICNHTLDPNAVCEGAEFNKMPFYILRALRDIAPHEEICINYGLTWIAQHKGTNILKKLEG